jgi:hypothetical protein
MDDLQFGCFKNIYKINYCYLQVGNRAQQNSGLQAIQFPDPLAVVVLNA